MRKKLLSAVLALLVTDIASGQCPLTFEGADQSFIGVYIAPINGGEPLVDYNSEKLFTPASVMKSVTTAAALSQRGGDYRWSTSVKAVGKIENGLLRGNLIVTGSGDPTLGSSYFSKNRSGFVATVREAARRHGITAVEGRVIEGGEKWPDVGPVPSWEIEDIPGIDGAGFYALNYMDNVFSLTYPSMKTVPDIPGLEVKYIGGDGAIGFTRFPGSTEVRIHGKLARKQKRAVFRCSMPNPTSVLLSQLDSVFSSRKKDVNPEPDTLTLTVYQSPMLSEVVRSMMVRSDNQIAEATLRLLAPRQPRSKALARERALLAEAGVSLSKSRLADGSGLSRHNSVSPRQLASVLSAMSSNEDYVASYARVGRDGTVRGFMEGIEGRENFVLKSGSMTGVVCYVGYRLEPGSTTPSHVIAVMINNAPGSKAARVAVGKLLGSLF